MFFAVPGAWRPAIVDKNLFSDRESITNVSVYVKRKSGQKPHRRASRGSCVPKDYFKDQTGTVKYGIGRMLGSDGCFLKN